MADHIVVGGGIIGMLTAWELLRAGQRVSLVERGETGRESSWAGGGILSPLYPWRFAAPVNELAAWSMAVYPDLAGELAERSGIDPQWTRSGMLVLDAPRDAARDWAERYTQRYDWLDAAQARALVPGLNPDEGAALWLPDIAQIRNPRLMKALRTASAGRGLEIHEHRQVLGFDIRDGAVRGVRTASGTLQAASVIVCGGAWTRQLLGTLGSGFGVEPVKGQMLMFHAEPGLLEHMVLSGGHYLIPRRDGRILAGSTLEYAGFDKSTSEEAHTQLYEAAIRLLPVLAQVRVERHWAGLRPGSPAGIPYICAHPEVRGLYVNAGHFRNGVILAPASARLMADIVLGREPILEAGEFAAGAEIVE